MVLNRLLRALPTSDRDLLGQSLHQVELRRGHVLEVTGQTTEHAYFPETGLVVVVASSAHWSIAVGVVGNDGMTGLDLVQGAGRAANETVVQAAGTALRIDARALMRAQKQSPTLRNMLLSYAHVFMVQASQTALTSGHANMEERLARWILMSHDRQEGDHLHVTHDFIALMLGFRRPGITVALHSLERRRLIKSTRDDIHVLGRQGLIDLASGSYGVCEAEYERLIDATLRKRRALSSVRRIVGPSQVRGVAATRRSGP